MEMEQWIKMGKLGGVAPYQQGDRYSQGDSAFTKFKRQVVLLILLSLRKQIPAGLSR